MSEVKNDIYNAAANTAQTADEAEDFAMRPVKKRTGRKIVKAIITLIVILLIAAAALYGLRRLRSSRMVETSASYTDYTVATRDITLNLSGTGSLSPADSYTVTTLISGEILSAPFEEGDVVEKNMTLYRVDSSDVSTGIEQAQNALAQTQRSYDQKLKSLEDLIIRANETGMILEMLVEAGDKVTAGQTVAKIRDSSVMSLAVPFSTDDADSFYIGQDAVITLDGTFEQLFGTVSKIALFEERLEGNMLVKTVTIDIPNPGGAAPEQEATARVGDTDCTGSGVFTVKGENTVTASMSGEVLEVLVGEGDMVTKNQEIITLFSESLENEILNGESSLRDSQLSLNNRYSQLDNYTIKSPIAGTIIEKNYKAGDTLESGKALCTIFDLSYLTMTLNIDELDIASIETGQEVTVTAEALPGRVYEGVVTKVNINGTTANGVTSYPVTIRIDETEGLLPGMNVQASIKVSESKNAVSIPVGALSRGNRVLVKADGSAQITPEGIQGTENGRMPEGMQSAEGGRMPEGMQGTEGGQMPGGMQSTEGGQMPGRIQDAGTGEISGGLSIVQGAQAPEGYVYVQVTPGISDGEYIEILEGLKVGDIIAIPETVIPESQGFFSMGQNMGGARTATPQGAPGGQGGNVVRIGG